jgi:hypothetical protein
MGHALIGDRLWVRKNGVCLAKMAPTRMLKARNFYSPLDMLSFKKDSLNAHVFLWPLTIELNIYKDAYAFQDLSSSLIRLAVAPDWSLYFASALEL